MSRSTADEVEGDDVDYPRFDHGEDLLVLIREDGSVEFQHEGPGSYLRADTVVPLDDAI